MARDQMLLNIVRLRYLEEPFFLTVSLVLTQNVYIGGIGASGSFNVEGESDLITGMANLN
jgi:hypothetical protein